MRFALLGIDDITLALAQAAIQSGRHQIVMIDALAARANEATAMAPHAALVADWNELLDTGKIDAVLVAADDSSRRIEQLRLLIQVGMPALVSHPISSSMLDCYELQMIERESNSVLLAYLPDRWHPAAIALSEMTSDSAALPIGAVEQISYERFLPTRDRQTVLRQFARDVDLLQFLAGDATKLHALGSGGGATTATAYANLAVQITSDEGMVCRWTVAPVDDRPGGRLTLVGANGKAVLWMPDSGEPWKLEVRAAKKEPVIDEYPEWNTPVEALTTFALACDHTEADSNWDDACRAIELAETIDRSLAKGRTIDLHNEEFSDIATFKGTMASVGCGLLLAAMVLLGVVAVVKTVAVHAGFPQVAAALDWFPYILLGVCGLFLLLQLLLLIAKPPDSKPPNDEIGSS